MLKVSNLSSGYGKKQVLFDVSFEVKQGEIVLLVGSNGSGKSTLLKTIYGLLPFWKFEDEVTPSIQFVSKNIIGAATSKLLNKGLLYIPQKNNLFEELTVKENLEMSGLILGHHKTVQARIEHSLSLFTMLIPHLKKIPMKLSGGERQLLTLAMTILHQPKMIMIDEPFTGLSPQNITLVAENLKTLNTKSGITLLIVEHRVKECSRIANRIIGLKLGRVMSELQIDTTFELTQLHSLFV